MSLMGIGISASSIASPVMQRQRHDGGGYNERVQHADCSETADNKMNCIPERATV
jgi:hypothetical protein